MNDAGIDYSLGMSNVDKETGIRYGVISGNAISSWSLSETLEPDYGKPGCGYCGNDATDYDEFFNAASEELQEEIETDWKHAKHECADYLCEQCKRVFGSESAYSDEAQGASYEDEHLTVCLDTSNDIWVFKSPYYTLCAYCSPCAPGAGYLTNQREHGIKAYCLPLDWFSPDENAPCPYKIFSVADDSLVYDPSNADDTDNE